MFTIPTPLEQFEVKALIPVEIFGLNLSFTNASVFMILTASLVLLLTVLGVREATIIPNK